MNSLTSISPTPTLPQTSIPSPTSTPPTSTDPTSPEQILYSNTHAEITFTPSLESNGTLSKNKGDIVIVTTNTSDTINITLRANNKLTANINNVHHELPFDADGKGQYLTIATLGGNDRVCVDPRVNVNVSIYGGKGDDLLTAGGGKTSIFGGPGKDYIRMGSGAGVAHGGDDDDVMLAGTGHASMSGGKGNDKLYAMYPSLSSRQVFLNGDDGNDQLYAGTGISVLNGGRGDDTLVGHRQTTFYTGDGKDHVTAYTPNSKIYAKATDTINNQGSAPVTQVKYADSGKLGFKIDGDEHFTELTENYIEQLRGSPAGQAMLKEMDSLAIKNGGPVTIKESEFVDTNAYLLRNSHTDKISLDQYDDHKGTPEFGYIKEGKAGSTATHADLYFDVDAFDKSITAPPLVALYHEMVHAYNGATGTFFPGSSVVNKNQGGPVGTEGKSETVDNSELQAVGLPTDNLPFDFDNNPLTPPTRSNPAPFTENALRAEMGVPLRQKY